jgi:hypothetical protein
MDSPDHRRTAVHPEADAGRNSGGKDSLRSPDFACNALHTVELPSVLLLFECCFVQDKALVLDICNAVLSLITGAEYSRFTSRGAKSNNIFDGQLHAWGVQPNLFRPVKTAAEQLNATLSAAQDTPSEDAFKELIQALNACS